MRAAALLLLALALAGCAQPRSVAECGLLVAAPARPIDEGVRFDVAEVVGDPPGVDVLDYRVTNASAEGRPVLFQGRLAELAANGTREFRYLDAREDGLLNVGDAFVARAFGDLVLQLSRGANLVGTSRGCA